MIRDEVMQLASELGDLAEAFVDGDKESAAEWIDAAFGIIKEGSDFVKIPKEERFKAVLLAFAVAAGDVATNAIKFSDEVVPS